MNKQITEATEKAVELIHTGNTEIWSAQLGDLTASKLMKVQVQLSKRGFHSVLLKNSFDNGLKVIL